MPRKTLAENPGLSVTGNASMRPRPDAAENEEVSRLPAADLARFNEAAARCRGKRT